ncbi:transcriptional regulator [Kitasatospora sp. MMS16-BH015]|uniref:response regulator transcription factor n=1 Tax=Kitasatospora sp. MMS16-BH015 TaxID=2018025 RepID=UPI000CA21240|nr:transcriptional regulator [Kitasatospora sp. MMS16-BH015]
MSTQSTPLLDPARTPHSPLSPLNPLGLRVLVVESDACSAATLVADLLRHGYQAESVATGTAALRRYPSVDLVLLDFELPDLDGLEVCRSIRAACCVPVIAVTARGSELDRVLGLRAGADDYLVKPYGLSELTARMDAVLRRAQPPRLQQPDLIDHGPLRIDAASRRITLAGRPVELTRKEFDLLHLLASHPESVIPRKQLIHQVWGGTWSRRTVDTHVSSLRGKLGSSAWIVTVRGVGFRLGHPPRPAAAPAHEAGRPPEGERPATSGQTLPPGAVTHPRWVDPGLRRAPDR